MIAARAQAILSGFWVDSGAADAIVALDLESWCDVLEPLSQGEIRNAWAEYQRSGPRSATGRLLRPDAGAIYKIAIAARPAQRKPAPKPEPPRPPRTQAEKDRIEAIVRGAGFGMRVVK